MELQANNHKFQMLLVAVNLGSKTCSFQFYQALIGESSVRDFTLRLIRIYNNCFVFDLEVYLRQN